MVKKKRTDSGILEGTIIRITTQFHRPIIIKTILTRRDPSKNYLPRDTQTLVKMTLILHRKEVYFGLKFLNLKNNVIYFIYNAMLYIIYF